MIVLFTTLLDSFSSQYSFFNLIVVHLNVCLGPRLPVFPHLLALSLIDLLLSCSQRGVWILFFGQIRKLFSQSYFDHADFLNWYDKFNSLNIHKASLLVDLVLCEAGDGWHTWDRHQHWSIVITIIWLLLTRTTVLLLELFQFIIDYIWYRLLKNTVLLLLHLLIMCGRMRLLSIRQGMASLKYWLIYRSSKSRFISINSSSSFTGGRSIIVETIMVVVIIILTVNWTWTL